MEGATAPGTGIRTDDHALGDEDAPVTLLEYGNYECLHCRRVYPVVEEIRAEMGDRLRFVYRHFALPADFPNAEPAAEAAEAAGAQGKFWEMHEALLTGEPLFFPEVLIDHAARLGLDARQVREDLATHRYQARVREDLASGRASGVRGTPAFFLNGQLVADSRDPEAFRGAVLAALDAATRRGGGR